MYNGFFNISSLVVTFLSLCPAVLGEPALLRNGCYVAVLVNIKFYCSDKSMGYKNKFITKPLVLAATGRYWLRWTCLRQHSTT